MMLLERLAIRGVVRGVRAMFGLIGTWRMTGSAPQSDGRCMRWRDALVRRWMFYRVRKLIKWEEVKEEGRWVSARQARAGG